MRILTMAAAAAVLLLPAAQQASAAAKKPTIQMSAKTKKEKVEYMRSAAGPEPIVKKHRKHKKHKMKKDKM